MYILDTSVPYSDDTSAWDLVFSGGSSTELQLSQNVLSTECQTTLISLTLAFITMHFKSNKNKMALEVPPHNSDASKCWIYWFKGTLLSGSANKLQQHERPLCFIPSEDNQTDVGLTSEIGMRTRRIILANLKAFDSTLHSQDIDCLAARSWCSFQLLCLKSVSEQFLNQLILHFCAQ